MFGFGTLLIILVTQLPLKQTQNQKLLKLDLSRRLAGESNNEKGRKT